MRLHRFGLFLVGVGETIADLGAYIAGTRRLRSELYPRALADEPEDVEPLYQDGVPLKPYVQSEYRRTDGPGWPD